MVDLVGGGPNIAKVDVVAVVVGGEGVGGEVDVGCAGYSVRDDQWRRGEVVGFDVWADAAFEVAVARKYGCRDELVFVMASVMGVGSGPELPMQVAQP